MSHVLNTRGWIRRNYVNDYFSTVYKLYVKQYNPSFNTVYYSANWQASVVGDNIEEIFGETYDKNAVGSMSGKMFRKIIDLPVFGVESVNPTVESSEVGGITFKQSLGTAIVFPQEYGLKPLPGDFVNMNSGLVNDHGYNRMLHIVSNVNVAHYGDDHALYRLELETASVSSEDVEKQLSGYFLFYDMEKTIVPYTNGVLLTKLLDRGQELTYNLKNLFKKGPEGMYIQEIEIP